MKQQTLIFVSNSSFSFHLDKMKNLSNQVIQVYKTLLKYSQLSINHQISFRNVSISQDSHIHEIHTIEKRQQKLPHLVLLHGFAGSSMSYIRTFRRLSQSFNVHALDHYGNGFSSRPDYDINRNQHQLLNLYVTSIQQWRKNLGLQKIVLAGHSFGAYIASLYTLQHKNIVDRLILLSPVGTSSQKQIHQQMQSRKSESLKNRISISLIQKIYNLNLEPCKIFQLPIIGDVIVNQFLKSTINLEKQEKQMWKEYIKYISQQQSHLQKSFYKCFEWPFVSKMMSISQIIEKIVQSQRQKPIQFYYGQNDWTQKVAAKKLQQRYQNVYLQILQKATHNMIFDFPEQVSDKIINGPQKKRTQNLIF